MAGQAVPLDAGELRPPYLPAFSNKTAAPGAELEIPLDLDAIYRTYAVRVRAYCARKLGDPFEAEDACHDVMLKAYRALPRFQSGAMWPWLVTIARNVCLDIHRRNTRRIRVQTKLERPAVAYQGPAGEQSAKQQTIEDAARRLPTRYRSLIVMADIEGWSYERIAIAHNTSVSAVRSALMRARRALRAELKRVHQPSSDPGMSPRRKAPA